ncbi:hypothetical protein RKD27_006031 [Streptomyces sp. SAI-126]|jgi:hypothetical protein|nr:hypothetical protein [Streptomyces sp. SAI-119]MDH6499315.1 hypothetical protein [Streptomyces sp. SAI-149]
MWRVTSGHADGLGYGAAAERVKPGPVAFKPTRQEPRLSRYATHSS